MTKFEMVAIAQMQPRAGLDYLSNQMRNDGAVPIHECAQCSLEYLDARTGATNEQVTVPQYTTISPTAVRCYNCGKLTEVFRGFEN